MILRRVLVVLMLAAVFANAQMSGKAAHEAFTAWRKSRALTDWDAATTAYRAKLNADGLLSSAIERASAPSSLTTKASGTTKSTPPPRPSTPSPTASSSSQ